MATSTKLSAREDLSETLNAIAKRQSSQSTATKTQVATETEFKNIESNTFKQIIESNLSRQEKVTTFAQELLKTDTKEQARAVIADLEEFKAYMQQERRIWSMGSLELASTEVLSELQGVYKEMNEGMSGINNELNPMVEMLQGLSELRLAGKTTEAYQEIAGDNEEAARRERVKAEQAARVDQIARDTKTAEEDLRVAKTKTRMLIGGYSKDQKEVIERLSMKIEDLNKENDDLTQEIIRTTEEFSKPRSSSLGDDPKIIKAKQQLTELMNTPEAELDAKQQRLKSAVMAYINGIDAKTKQARSTLEKQAEQCTMSLDQAGAMRSVYAIINDATKEAKVKSQDNFAAVEGEISQSDSESRKIELEERQAVLSDHIDLLSSTGRETLDTLAEVTSSQMRVKAMQDSNRQEIQKVNRLHTSGNAGMAERLLTVFNGVNAAASHEASAMVENSIGAMNESTTKLLHRGILANAIGLGEENEARLKVIADMEDASKVLRAATEEQASQLAALDESNQQMFEQAEALKKDLAAMANLNARNKSANDNVTDAGVARPAAAKVENRFNKPPAP
jgi:hypothetical protein